MGEAQAGLLSRLLAEWGVRAEAALSGLIRREITVGEHRIVYFDTRSPPSGRHGNDEAPIVMLHGFGGDKLNWLRYARHLTRDYRVVIPDLPGFGESDRHHHLTYSIENQTAWLAAFLDALGIHRAHIAGNSMGGHIATCFAARHPERVATLILHAPAGTTGAAPPWDMSKIQRGRHPLMIFTPADFDQMMRWIFVKPPVLIGPLRRYFAAKAIEGRRFNEKVFDDIKVSEGNAVMDPMLPSMTAPALVIWGDTDPLLDCAHIKTYERLMPNVRSFVLPQCGHLPMAERPRETARMTLSFLESAEVRGAAPRAA